MKWVIGISCIAIVAVVIFGLYIQTHFSKGCRRKGPR